ncbi:antitoxin Xre/MbcA/ParS toxin-binding domain-containing protein [Neptunomonas sp.]|uniref:antitoxin Xre/MbcA/ParS toxin-binding domain-containing protein n=1 Tax=Neptunomonas sp. TaxID=1971898 RepID=UPI003565A86D
MLNNLRYKWHASATEYFGDEDQAKKWMHTPQVIFGNKSNIEYLDTMTGIGYVSDIINRMKYGMIT